MNSPIVRIESLYKSFKQPDDSYLKVIKGINLSINKGDIYFITGASGSGKSTLLHLIGSFDKPDSGKILYDGEDLSEFKKKRITKYRNSDIGFVYQFHYLMPELTVLENVEFPMLIKNFNKIAAEKKASVLLKKVGLGTKLKNMPYDLSGGERQRAAIARSLVNSPKLLLADEPTGNLDSKTGEIVFNLFLELIREEGLSAIIATHNENLIKKSPNRLNLV